MSARTGWMDPAKRYTIEVVEGASDDAPGALRVAGVFAKIRPNLKRIWMQVDKDGIWYVEATYASEESAESMIFSRSEARG